MLFPNMNLIFIDNESVCKDVLRKHGYNEYFNDQCAGDFGHCTDKGNLLLSMNIINHITRCIPLSKGAGLDDAENMAENMADNMLGHL